MVVPEGVSMSEVMTLPMSEFHVRVCFGHGLGHELMSEVVYVSVHQESTGPVRVVYRFSRRVFQYCPRLCYSIYLKIEYIFKINKYSLKDVKYS